MLGDVLLITEKHHKAGAAIIEHILRNKSDKFLVGISGESGSGKTELAHVIARGMREHGIVAKPLHIDNYYRIHPLQRTAWRKQQGIEKVVGYGEYDWDAIYKTLQEFKQGESGSMPCID
ncbi:MAG: hypothetical protein KJP04_05000, partial [Arenicella sp.]|nr:hypothetical protein [Arenicella sp.]